MVSKENFKFEESEVEEVNENQMLLKNLYFGFDPTQRGWLNDMKSYMPPVHVFLSALLDQSLTAPSTFV